MARAPPEGRRSARSAPASPDRDRRSGLRARGSTAVRAQPPARPRPRPRAGSTRQVPAAIAEPTPAPGRAPPFHAPPPPRLPGSISRQRPLSRSLPLRRVAAAGGTPSGPGDRPAATQRRTPAPPVGSGPWRDGSPRGWASARSPSRRQATPRSRPAPRRARNRGATRIRTPSILLRPRPYQRTPSRRRRGDRRTAARAHASPRCPPPWTASRARSPGPRRARPSSASGAISSPGYLHVQRIAEPPVRPNEPARPAFAVPQLPAEVAHVDVDDVAGRLGREVVDVLPDLCPGHNLAPPQGEIFEQGELPGRQRDRLAATPGCSCRQIDLQVGHHEEVGRRPIPAANNRPQAREELIEREGLHQIVVRAGVEPPDAIGHLIAGRHHEDRRGGTALPKTPQDRH